MCLLYFLVILYIYYNKLKLKRSVWGIHETPIKFTKFLIVFLLLWSVGCWKFRENWFFSSVCEKRFLINYCNYWIFTIWYFLGMGRRQFTSFGVFDAIENLFLFLERKFYVLMMCHIYSQVRRRASTKQRDLVIQPIEETTTNQLEILCPSWIKGSSEKIFMKVFNLSSSQVTLK